jgi:hypothetical protein
VTLSLLCPDGLLGRSGAGQPPQFNLDECGDGFELFLQVFDARLVFAP